MASILQGGKRPAPAMPAHEDGGEPAPMHGGGDGEARSTLVSHGDGTHHIEHEDGSTTDHAHIGHALMHLAGKHSEGVHHHSHSDGMGGGVTTHHASHGGEPEGPNEHENAESAATEMKEVMGGGEEDGGDWNGKDGGKQETSDKGKDY